MELRGADEHSLHSNHAWYLGCCVNVSHERRECCILVGRRGWGAGEEGLGLWGGGGRVAGAAVADSIT